MGSKTRLSSYCTKRANNGVNLVTSRKINTRLARPIMSGRQIRVLDNADSCNHIEGQSSMNIKWISMHCHIKQPQPPNTSTGTVGATMHCSNFL